MIVPMYSRVTKPANELVRDISKCTGVEEPFVLEVSIPFFAQRKHTNFICTLKQNVFVQFLFNQILQL